MPPKTKKAAAAKSIKAAASTKGKKIKVDKPKYRKTKKAAAKRAIKAAAPKKGKSAIVVDKPYNDEQSWSVCNRKIFDVIYSDKNISKAARRQQLFEFKNKGYTAIMLSKDCMDLLSDGCIQLTLSNMLKYGSTEDEVNGSSFVFQKPGKTSSKPELSQTRKMMYLGYDFNANIPNIQLLSLADQESLSVHSMTRAKEFLTAAKEYIAKQLDFFTPPSKLKPETVAVSILENYTGQPSYPLLEQNQAWHSDYDAKEIPHDTANTALPAVALLALADGVKLGMLPGSHKIVSKEGVNKMCQPIEFQFKLGEILIFHPLFVHYGCSYTAHEKNLRVHFYFDNEELVRGPGDGHLRTYCFNLTLGEVTFPSDPQENKSRRGANFRKNT